MIKIVVMFLMLMLIVSMIGNFVTKFLRGDPPAPPKMAKGQSVAKCSHCGRPVIGTAPCVCGKG